jgi:hypothetical protein
MMTTAAVAGGTDAHGGAAASRNRRSVSARDAEREINKTPQSGEPLGRPVRQKPGCDARRAPGIQENQGPRPPVSAAPPRLRPPSLPVYNPRTTTHLNTNI